MNLINNKIKIIVEKYGFLKLIYGFLFLVSVFYVTFVQSSLFESKSEIIVRDLGKPAMSTGLDLSMLGGPASSQSQDSMVIETYLMSYDVLEALDSNFSLNAHYQSGDVDIVDRLGWFHTKEDFLALYQKRILIDYDELSGILSIRFLHTDSKIAQKIVTYLIQKAEEQLNMYNHKNAQQELAFITKRTEYNRNKLDRSINKLKSYQNSHKILDPASDAQTKSALIGEIESKIVADKTQLSQLTKYMNDDSFDIIKLKSEIVELTKSLKNIRSELSGDKVRPLNTILFEYEQLKSEVEFETEVYKQSLAQLEISQIEVVKKAKTLVVLTQPYLAESAQYPEKLKSILTLMILFSLSYAIVGLLQTIIKDHKG